MRRLLASLAATYLALALFGKYKERTGAIRCGCADACWCKKPGLSLFRWVAPIGHKGMTPEQKRALDPNAIGGREMLRLRRRTWRDRHAMR